MTFGFGDIVRDGRETGREMFFELVKWLRGRGATPLLRASCQNRPRLRSMYLLRRSEIRRALLSLLSSKPRHAYELMERLEGKEGGTAKSVYPALQRLCDEGLVKVDAHHSWRTYWLSAAGQAELQSGTASKLRNHSTAGRTRFPGYKAADLNAQVATFAAHVMGEFSRSARFWPTRSMRSRGWKDRKRLPRRREPNPILKDPTHLLSLSKRLEILEQTKRKIEGLEQSS